MDYEHKKYEMKDIRDSYRKWIEGTATERQKEEKRIYSPYHQQNL